MPCHRADLTMVWIDPTMSEYGSDPKEKATPLAEAIKVVKYGFRPEHWMPDKCRAQINTMLSGEYRGTCLRGWLLTAELVFPDCRVRLCRFHVIQAWLRWNIGNGGKKKKQRKATPVIPKIPLNMKDRYITATKLFQRVRETDDVSLWKTQYLKRLRRITYGLKADFEIRPEELAEIDELLKAAERG